MPEPPSNAGMAVLVVEGDPDIRRMLAAAFRGWGIAAHFAAAGEEAIEIFRQHVTRINLALLEVALPLMDGPSTLTALRAIRPNLRCWFVGGHGVDYTRQQLLAFGAIDVLPKPFDLKKLRTLLTSVDVPSGDGGAP